jgi:hypothetical protein
MEKVATTFYARLAVLKFIGLWAESRIKENIHVFECY